MTYNTVQCPQCQIYVARGIRLKCPRLSCPLAPLPKQNNFPLWWKVFAFLCFLGLVLLLSNPSRAEPSNDGYQQKFIQMNPSASCCWSSSCCFEVSENELIDLGNDNYQIKKSGTTLKAGRSIDHNHYLCACTMVSSGKYRIGVGEQARCLFTPFKSM